MAELSVELTAKIDRLEKALNKAKKELKDFEKGADRANTNTGKSFQKVGKGATNVTPTLLEFNRVIQDAPFGIQGVANNLQQLTQNFGYLRQQTGSTGSALKALLAGFTGPAGILFAVSAATSLLTVYGDKLLSAGGATSELAKATKDYTGSAKAEITELKALVQIASDEENSKKLRENALKRINDKYGDYLGNLTTESIKTQSVTDAINRLNEALLNEAKIRGIRTVIEQKFGDLAEKIAKREEAFRVGSAAALRQQNDSLRERQRALEQTIPSVQKAAKEDDKAAATLVKLQQEYDNITKQLSGEGQQARRANIISDLIKSDSQGAEAEIQRLQEILKPLLEFDLLNGLGNGGKPKKLLTTEQINEILNAEELENAVNDAVGNLVFAQQAFVQSGAAAKEAANDGLDEGVWDSFFKITQLEEAEKRLRARLEAIQTGLQNILTDGAANIISGVSQAFGEAIANGDNIIKSVGSSLLSTIGGILVDLGKLAIATGIGIAAVKKALSTLNPVVAIAAGAALVAIGSAFKAGASNIARSAGGGNVGGQGTSSFGSFQGGGTATVSGGGGFNGRVVFEISGQKLIGVLNNSLSANQRLGGNVSLG